jgi:hypothetical protein
MNLNTKICPGIHVIQYEETEGRTKVSKLTTKVKQINPVSYLKI